MKPERWRGWVAAGLCAAVVAAAVLLPPVLATARDGAILGSMQLLPAEGSIVFQTNEMSTADKLSLLQSAQRSDFVSLEVGDKLDPVAALSSAAAGVDDLIARGLVPPGEVYWDASELSAYFVLNASDPGMNVIVWTLTFYMDMTSGTLCIDNDTGLVLQCVLYTSTDHFAAMEADQWLKAWGNYLGLTYDASAPHDPEHFDEIEEAGRFLSEAASFASPEGRRVDIMVSYMPDDFGVCMFGYNMSMEDLQKRVAIW